MPATRTRRSRLRVWIAAFMAASQFAVVSFAPALDARAGASAPTHVEDFGVHLHFAHNPDDCAACTALTLVAVSPAPAPAFAVSGTTATAFAAAELLAPERDAWRSDAARAPPALPGARSLI